MARGRSRAEYRRGPLVEWYRNDEEGLALGMRVDAPPEPGSGAPLRLALAWDGDLVAQGGDGPGVAFASNGEVVLRLGSLVALDAAGQSLEVQVSAGNGVLILQVDDAGAIYPVELAAAITGLPAAADWTLTWGATNTSFGYSVATAGDVNGDGRADVIVGAPRYDHPESNEGGAWVYHGTATGVNSAPAFFARSDQEGARLGVSVASAGDVNGDGYADIIVGAQWYAAPTAGEGAAFVWYGSSAGANGGANGSPANANWRAESDQASAWLGYSVVIRPYQG